MAVCKYQDVSCIVNTEVGPHYIFTYHLEAIQLILQHNKESTNRETTYILLRNKKPAIQVIKAYQCSYLHSVVQYTLSAAANNSSAIFSSFS
jgi:hypothetical protein